MPENRRMAFWGAGAANVKGVAWLASAYRRSGRTMVNGMAGAMLTESQCQESGWQVIVPLGLQSLVGL